MMGGLPLPDVVRMLLREPSILRWHAEEEVYEVMDGMSFERRCVGGWTWFHSNRSQTLENM